MPTIWKVNCEENRYPGMWQRWFKNQCVAVGWPTQMGCKLHGKTKGGRGWEIARKAIKDMAVGDFVIVALRGLRIGRLGVITGKAIEDNQWDPLAPGDPPKLSRGDKGRRIFVRWELTTGPDDRDLVVRIPPEYKLKNNELRLTVSKIKSRSIEEVRNMMNDPKNWVGLHGRFGYEKALSDYIANYPYYLEDGLLPHPSARIRELVFKDKSRLDVLLIDRTEQPVIVECKQHAPSVGDVKQLRDYLRSYYEITHQEARGILVHGGSQKLPAEVIQEAQNKPYVEVVSYRLRVDFTPSQT